MTYSSLDPTTDFFAWLNATRDHLRANWGQIHRLESPFGIHSVEYHTPPRWPDYFGYAIIGFTLPDGVYAEIEDGTYGTLNGFRIYYTEDEEGPDDD